LGCGIDDECRFLVPKDNEKITNLDERGPYANVIHDMNKYPYPFSDNTFDEIYMNHSSYYVKDKTKFIKEIHRIAKPGAKVIIRSAHFSRCIYKIYGDYLFFKTVDSFKWFDGFIVEKVTLSYFLWHEDNNLWKRLLSAPINFLANINPKFCERVWCYWVGGFDEIVGVLIVKK